MRKFWQQGAHATILITDFQFTVDDKLMMLNFRLHEKPTTKIMQSAASLRKHEKKKKNNKIMEFSNSSGLVFQINIIFFFILASIVVAVWRAHAFLLPW